MLVVGVAYKPDTGDQRESPSLKIIELRQEYGANVERADAAVVVTPHSDLDLSLLEGLPVLDTRNVMEESSAERL